MNQYNWHNKYLHIYSAISELYSWKMKKTLKNWYLLIKKLTFVKTVDQWSGWSSNKINTAVLSTLDEHLALILENIKHYFSFLPSLLSSAQIIPF